MKMKTIALAVVLPLCFLSSAIKAKPLFAVTGKDNVGALEPVLDTDGEEVRTDQTYHVKAIPEGGLTMAYASYSQLYVVQDVQDSAVNLPLEFTLADTTGDVVPVSTDLYIKFAVTPCSNCSAWSYNAIPFFVHAGEKEGVFQIIHVEDKFYKFAIPVGSALADIRIYIDSSTHLRHLATIGETLYVEFVKGKFSPTS